MLNWGYKLPGKPTKKKRYLAIALRAGPESPKEHYLDIGTDFLRTFCVIWPNPLSLPWTGSNAMVKVRNKEETSPRAQYHGDPPEKQHCGSYSSNRTDGQDFPLLLSASRGRSSPLLPELSKLLFFISTSWNLSMYLSRITAFSSQWLHKKSRRNISCQGRNTSRCSLFLSFWENDMTEMPASLNLGNFLMEMTVFFLDVIGSLALLTHREAQGVSHYTFQYHWKRHGHNIVQQQ